MSILVNPQSSREVFSSSSGCQADGEVDGGGHGGGLQLDLLGCQAVEGGGVRQGGYGSGQEGPSELDFLHKVCCRFVSE